MTLAEAATPPARLASWKFRFLGVSVSVDSVHVEFVPCHSAGTLPSLHALTRCVLFGQVADTRCRTRLAPDLVAGCTRPDTDTKFRLRNSDG